MSSRGLGLKLALLGLPLALGVAGLHAWGEAAGRTYRTAIAGWEYPEHVQGRFHLRERRGSESPLAVAQMLDQFTQEMTRRWTGPPPGALPPRVTVIVVDSAEDLEAFVPPERLRLARGGEADLPSGRITLVGPAGRDHSQGDDARTLRHLLTQLLFPGATFTWVTEGLAAHVESPSKGTPPGLVRGSRGAPPPLSTLMDRTESDFQGVAGGSLREGAELW
ncbi:MAG TPA: hypothetical protein VEN81_04760, partial [Planctomycetota bacterium]|nr:hypothetical protein [Planctomycetota bacterium]